VALASVASGAATAPPQAIASGNGAAAIAGADVSREPVTERRLVSVLFADLVGFTTLSEARDSEEVRELLSRYFESCQTVVVRYGGVVEKFIGDAVMAVWGAPVANEDDAERAVRAALQLVDAVTELGAEIGVPELRARAGVLTGEATVNLGANGQGMVAGDLVNTASRLQATAEPGAVVVGDVTKRATDAAVTYTDVGMQTLKGKAEPMRLWRAHRVVAGVGGLMKSEGLEAPFVGRDRELKLVKDLFHACVDEGKAHVVQVTGIAGIGKSRLGWEFFKYMDGLRRLFRWHRGRCLSYGEGVTYWALAEMVRGRAEITEGEERTSAVTKLHDAVERYVPDPADRRFVEPRLAHLLGLEERTAPDKGDLFAGWRLFFERLAAVDPVVMVFEDLQWADPSLLEFIDHLLEWSRSFPIFVLTLARPGGDAVGARPRRNATSIYLEPLSRQAMEELLTGLVPGLPTELTTKILDRAEGVPLYAVETVRMLLDRGLLAQEGSVYQPTGRIEDLEVPETLHALIAARLDGLTAAERRLVQDASVLGKTCSRAALAAVSGFSERDLEPLLAALLSKEVLFVQADPRSPERGQYGFLQDLVRTVAYETLSKKDRKAKHLEVAAYLERAWGSDEEEIVEVVASHFAEAYRLAPDADDAGPIRDKARRMLVRAGERAASLAAATEADAYFVRAAELADSLEERARLNERSGEMAQLLGRIDDAAAHFAEAKRLFEAAAMRHPAARAQAHLADTARMKNHIEEAIEGTRGAYATMAGDDRDPDFAIVAGQLGRFLAIAGRDSEATPILEEALRLAEQHQLWEVYSHALSSRAVGLQRQARFDEAVTLLRRALEVALDKDYPAAALRAWNNLSVALESQDRFRETLELMPPTLELARRKGDRANELVALTGFIFSMVQTGRWDEALALADEARAAEELESIPFAAVGLVDLIRIHVRRGDMDAAGELVNAFTGRAGEDNIEVRMIIASAAAEYLRASGRADEAVLLGADLVTSLPVLGLPSQAIKHSLVQSIEAAIDMGDLDKADEFLGIPRRALPGLVTPMLRAHVAQLTARIEALRGGHDAVEAGLQVALVVFRSIGMPFEAGVTLLELGEWLAEQGRYEEAAPALAEAREIFERLKARPWLERLAQVELTPVAAMEV
jgi:class 3 adenylate cyclase/tetratricopeptide (TPR) repeat protein